MAQVAIGLGPPLVACVGLRGLHIKFDGTHVLNFKNVGTHVLNFKNVGTHVLIPFLEKIKIKEMKN
jgi:hypothetical protein